MYVAGHKEAVTSFILDEWDRSVPEAVTQAAQDIAARYHGAVSGVIFYGSCLRTGIYEDRILDFYVIVDNYPDAYRHFGLAFFNEMIPPNVFYHEIEVGGTVVRSKYAVLSLTDLALRTGPGCLNVSVWARFCQPCMLLLPASNAVKYEIAGYIASAAVTMLGHALPLLGVQALSHRADGGLIEQTDTPPEDEEKADEEKADEEKARREGDKALSQALWVTAFTQTYSAELRSEPPGKGLEIYELDKDRYDALLPYVGVCLGLSASKRADLMSGYSPQAILPDLMSRKNSRALWFARRLNGKFVSFMRLIKASFTFTGGIDYLAWKISRHSGVAVTIKPWMRYVPILAGLYLFISLRLKGAFR